MGALGLSTNHLYPERDSSVGSHIWVCLRIFKNTHPFWKALKSNPHFGDLFEGTQRHCPKYLKTVGTWSRAVGYGIWAQEPYLTLPKTEKPHTPSKKGTFTGDVAPPFRERDVTRICPDSDPVDGQNLRRSPPGDLFNPCSKGFMHQSCRMFLLFFFHPEAHGVFAFSALGSGSRFREGCKGAWGHHLGDQREATWIDPVAIAFFHPQKS